MALASHCLHKKLTFLSSTGFHSEASLIMNTLSSTRKEVITKHLARATSLPAELSRYSKNCKLLCNILRDTKIIINEINTADYLAQGELIYFFPKHYFDL